MKSFRNIQFYLIALLCVHADGLSQNAIAQANAKVEELLKHYVSYKNIPGMSVTVTWNDSVVLSKGYGFADLENKIAVNPSKTRFRMASIAKTMTAATIARLSELGHIDLQKSPLFYLDSLPKKKYDFTIEQIGAHLSGIKRTAGTELYSCDNTYNRSDFYRIYASDKLLFEPSTQFEYSNYGFRLLGLVVEKITGASIVDSHKKYIIDKIGLLNTLPETKTKDSLAAKFYIRKNKRLVEAPCLDCTFKYAMGCYWSTSEDLVKLGNAYLYPDRILKAETIRDITRSRRLKNGWKTDYGFGFTSFVDFFGHYCYGHNGGYDSARSALAIYPDSKIVIAILINRQVDDIDSLVAEISNSYIAALGK